MEVLVIVPDKPTGHVLIYRGNKYEQWLYKRGEYPADLWLTYRNVRYRPANLKCRQASLTQKANKVRSTLIT